MRAGLILALFLTGAAHATPPRIVGVEQTAVGMDTDTVWLVVTLDDNLGIYYATLYDTYLVPLNVESGAYGTPQLLYRFLRTDPEIYETPSAAIATGSEVDLYGTLADAGAAPIMAGAEMTPADHPLNAGPLEVNFGGRIFVLDPDTAMSRMQAGLAVLAGGVRPYDQPGLEAVAIPQVLSDRVLRAEFCEVEHTFLARPTDYARITLLASVACGQDNDEPTRMILPLVERGDG